MGQVFERVVIVFLENTMRSSALANDYLNRLRRKGVFLTNAQGVTHPSQPNYIATIAGDTMGIADDDPHYMLWYWLQPSSEQAKDSTGGQYRYHEEGFSAPTIVDLLEAQNLSWKCYVEDLPPDAEYKDKLDFDLSVSPEENLKNVPPDAFPYARKHVPFFSFPSIVSDPQRLARIGNACEFERDLRQEESPHRLPHYSFYVPNLLNDGHNDTEEIYRPAANNLDLGPDTPNLDNIARFLKSFLGDDPVARFPPETLIVITFDEAYPYPFDYGIYTLLLGDFLEPGTINTEPVNHYNLLRSIEENFGLGSLKRHDAMARPYWFL